MSLYLAFLCFVDTQCDQRHDDDNSAVTSCESHGSRHSRESERVPTCCVEQTRRVRSSSRPQLQRDGRPAASGKRILIFFSELVRSHDCIRSLSVGLECQQGNAVCQSAYSNSSPLQRFFRQLNTEQHQTVGRGCTAASNAVVAYFENQRYRSC